jgi:MFS family permease
VSFRYETVPYRKWSRDRAATISHRAPRRWAILAVLVVSLLVVVLDNTVLNVALRVLADPATGLGATQAELAWAINAYTLVFAGLLFTGGVLGDRWGRRRVLLGGLALFGLASLASAYARDPGQLIAARAVMGIGGAAVTPTALSIISNVFDPRERAGRSASGRALSATAASGLLLIGATAPDWTLCAVLFLYGAGMANVVPPATEAVMSALPPEKAGVGSAVSNTIRQVAAALGVAALGSVAVATYRDRLAGSLAPLPAPLRPVAAESISGAHAVAGDLGPAGAPLVAAANDAFVTGMHRAAVLAALAVALGAAVVLAWLPGRWARQASAVPVAAEALASEPGRPERG